MSGERLSWCFVIQKKPGGTSFPTLSVYAPEAGMFARRQHFSIPRCHPQPARQLRYTIPTYGLCATPRDTERKPCTSADIFARHALPSALNSRPPKRTRRRRSSTGRSPSWNHCAPRLSPSPTARAVPRAAVPRSGERIKTQTPADPIPHLPTVCHQEPEVRALLEAMSHRRFNILAPERDPPRDGELRSFPGRLSLCSDLVRYIRSS